MDLPSAPTPPMNGGGGGMGQNPDRTANLLSLLKFSDPSSSGSQPSLPQAQPRRLGEQPVSAEGGEEEEEEEEDEEEEQQAEHRQAGRGEAGEEVDEDEDEEAEEGEEEESGEKLRPRQPSHQADRQPSNASLQAQAQSGFQVPTRIHQPAPTAADPSGLLAALMRGAHDIEEPKSHASPPPTQPIQPIQQPTQPTQPTNPFANNGSPSSDTRSYLLNLLNRPKPSQTDQPMLVESSASARATESVSRSIEESPADPTRYLSGPPHQPSNPYHSHQPYQPDAFAEAQRPQNTNPYQYKSSPSVPVQEPADMSAIYQQLMGSLNQASPHNASSSGGNNNNSNNNNNSSSSSSGNGTRNVSVGSAHGSAPASNAGSYHIVLKKDQMDRLRHGKVRSPLADPPGQPLSIDRSSSLRSHRSNQSTRLSAVETPPAPDSAGLGAIGKKDDQSIPEAVGRDGQTSLEHDAAFSFDSDGAKADPHQHQHQHQHQLEHQHQHYSSFEGEPPALEPEEPSSQEPARDNRGVADNWESAEQDDTAAAHEKQTPAVRVFNFPMKPWISITLKDDATEPRPQFRDESIMDIARLKKDFDQIDRNLYTASQTYMTYGMSKQGGLRVIRQDDGKDAKAFPDTKDRVFNVAMSITPPDSDGVHREAIIGTGISGTVYWVQIKDGEKDHIEDHLEQYGFALPPFSSPDGDAPGGALKTRARASTTHPEFFAVGRGKSINFIWPSYIMQKNLFKPGHDRVVDTEALLDQCSLKINTGKAGKDFTFSQDDTAVVSLDKSGRVKFWDIRDLVSAKEGTESLPLPAHSSLEVKEPIMTLASGPEGEKPWPTSVLLLDKQRPYQKRCALRYMIVGMKQNHTLQLWDLALGKPVQEFNLPHSKESDAVCSVMYHPASGMVIIGHPTRNSVYFAHLSAPKYNLKSVSQAEYIQRIVAQDPSIPQPDSTAVISGVREYSFANRGILRSLDILTNPAMVHDADEPTLFELYAMHSKGVACLLIRQAELGWSKDNKVLEPVDAISEGVVTVAKLKTPLQTEVVQPSTALESVSSSAPMPIRIAHRALPKGSENAPAVQSTPTSTSETTPRGPESSTPIRIKHEANKEVETPVQSSKESHGEKPGWKQRLRRKGKEAEATPINGAPHRMDHPTNTAVKSFRGPGGVSGIMGGTSGLSSDAFDSVVQFDSVVHALEARLGAAMSDTLKASLSSLQTKLDESARVRDEGFNQHQLKLLDMVSEVLNENTQKVLETLVQQQFTDVLIPSIGEKTSKAVAELLQNKLAPSLASSVQKEVQHALPQAVNRSFRSSDFLNTLSDRVSTAVSANVQQELLATISHRLTSSLTTVATQSAQRVASELHQSYQDQLEQLQAQHAADANKIDQLLSYVSRLTDMVSTMAASQSSLQAEFIKLKSLPLELPSVHGIHPHHQPSSIAHSLSHGYGNNITSPRGSYAPSQAPSQLTSHPHGQYVTSPQYLRGSQPVPSPLGSVAAASEHVAPVTSVNALAGAYAHQMSKTEAEADHDLIQRIRVIETAIQEKRLQDAMIRWIQSGREEEIFRRSLSRYPASKFESLPPLMLLVVIATISKDLKPNSRLKEEVDWIEMAVRAFGSSFPHFGLDGEMTREVATSTSQTMQLLINRIQPLLVGMQDGYPTDPFLANVDRGKLEWIVVTSQQILDTFTRGSR